ILIPLGHSYGYWMYEFSIASDGLSQDPLALLYRWLALRSNRSSPNTHCCWYASAKMTAPIKARAMIRVTNSVRVVMNAFITVFISISFRVGMYSYKGV